MKVFNFILWCIGVMTLVLSVFGALGLGDFVYSFNGFK